MDSGQTRLLRCGGAGAQLHRGDQQRTGGRIANVAPLEPALGELQGGVVAQVTKALSWAWPFCAPCKIKVAWPRRAHLAESAPVRQPPDSAGRANRLGTPGSINPLMLKPPKRAWASGEVAKALMMAFRLPRLPAGLPKTVARWVCGCRSKPDRGC